MVLPEREFDNAIMAEELSGTAIERNQSSDDAKISASLGDVILLHQFGYRLLYEQHIQCTRKMTLTNSQDQERHCEEEEQSSQSN